MVSLELQAILPTKLVHEDINMELNYLSITTNINLWNVFPLTSVTKRKRWEQRGTINVLAGMCEFDQSYFSFKRKRKVVSQTFALRHSLIFHFWRIIILFSSIKPVSKFSAIILLSVGGIGSILAMMQTFRKTNFRSRYY